MNAAASSSSSSSSSSLQGAQQPQQPPPQQQPSSSSTPHQQQQQQQQRSQQDDDHHPSSKKSNTKSRKPKNSDLAQQRLKAWQPILSPPWVIITFLIISVVFIGIGILLLLTSEKIVEIERDYTELCQPQANQHGARVCKIDQLAITPQRDMVPPIYMYYKLENYYQNHRRYASSRSDVQLAGTATSYGQVSGVCSPIVVNQPAQGNGSALPSEVYNPCGLIAWSMFNDTFKLSDGGSGDVICDGPRPDGVRCTKKGIAWESDVNTKFRPPSPDTEELNNVRNPKFYYNEPGHTIPEVTDEDFIVWMRTAALPNFRKLYRIINTELKGGRTYHLDIEYNYPVLQFGGRKKIILTTSSWIGGKNMFMAISYIVVGGVCFILAVLFTVGAIVQQLRTRTATNAVTVKT